MSTTNRFYLGHQSDSIISATTRHYLADKPTDLVLQPEAEATSSKQREGESFPNLGNRKRKIPKYRSSVREANENKNGKKKKIIVSERVTDSESLYLDSDKGWMPGNKKRTKSVRKYNHNN